MTMSTTARRKLRHVAAAFAVGGLLVAGSAGSLSASTDDTTPTGTDAGPMDSTPAQTNMTANSTAGTAPTDSAPSATHADGSDLDPVAMIVAQGGLGDLAYNDLANEGLQAAAEETGVEVQAVEAEDIVVEGEQVVTRAVDSGFGLVVDLEFSHNEFLPQIAADNPDTDFAFLNLSLEGDNIMSLVFQEQEGSYLAGALAARMTTVEGNDKINPEQVIGVIGGFQSPGIDKFIVGFIQGAHDVDPDVEVLVSYTNDFGDPAIGKDAAIAMYDQGADIVYQVAGGAGLGVIEAAQETNHYAIGVDANQDDLAPGYVLTSMIKRTDFAVEQAVYAYVDGNFAGGQTVLLGLAEDAVGLSDFANTRDDIPDEVLAELDDLKQQIIDGDIEVWNVVDQGYPDFYNP